MGTIAKIDDAFKRGGIYFTLHLMVLALSIFMVITISVDTFKNIAFYRQPEFLKIETWICVVFLFDFFVELLLSQRKRRYLLTHFLFFLVSIPYLAIFEWLDLDFSAHIEYLIRFIPLVKGGYAMAIVVGWFTYNKATGLFVTYMVTFVATVYFGSVAFYIFERGVNQAVTCYADALWWASMDVTTVGSDIVAVTPVGRVLSVILAALGMMMLPIFTVYVTSLITDKRTSADVLRLNGAIPPDAGNPK